MVVETSYQLHWSWVFLNINAVPRVKTKQKRLACFYCVSRDANILEKRFFLCDFLLHNLLTIVVDDGWESEVYWCYILEEMTWISMSAILNNSCEEPSVLCTNTIYTNTCHMINLRYVHKYRSNSISKSRIPGRLWQWSINMPYILILLTDWNNSRHNMSSTTSWMSAKHNPILSTGHCWLGPPYQTT